MGPSKLFSRALQVILQYVRIPALKSTPGHVREPGRSPCVPQGLTLPGLPGLRLKCQIAKASGVLLPSPLQPDTTRRGSSLVTLPLLSLMLLLCQLAARSCASPPLWSIGPFPGEVRVRGRTSCMIQFLSSESPTACWVVVKPPSHPVPD